MAEPARRRRERVEPEAQAAAARSLWSGTVTFGLVAIPVDLYPAHRSARTSLRMLGPEGHPLGRRYVDPESGRPLGGDQIVRGYPDGQGGFVTVRDRELEALAPGGGRDIELDRFVELASIDPVYFERTYFLAPSSRSTKAYRLLAAALESDGRAGIAEFAMRGKRYLVAIVARQGILRAEVLRYADEVRAPEDVGLPAPERPSATLVRRFERAIRAHEADGLDRDELADPYAAALHRLVERKLAAKRDLVEVEVEEAGGDEGEEIPDLMNVLKWSLARGRERRARGGGDGGGRAPEPSSRRRRRDDLERLGKRELYERARELDIAGRSSMTKAELARAIRESA